MSAEAADRIQQAQNTYDAHTAVRVDGFETCTGCRQPWPCPSVREVLPLLLGDDSFLT
jgi:hypothetical protein